MMYEELKHRTPDLVKQSLFKEFEISVDGKKEKKQ